MPADKTIITCAITGSIHTPSMSPHLPVTPQQIAEQAIDAAEAGAAILHLHARNPVTGQPSPDPELFRQFVPEIRSNTDAIIAITTGGSASMALEERLAAPLQLRPEMCSLNMGSMNFGIFPMGEKKREWRHAWEQPFLEATRQGIFKNTFADIERILRELGEVGTRFEFECYDIGHLHTLAYFVERGLVEPPFFVQSVVGILGGPAVVNAESPLERLIAMKEGRVPLPPVYELLRISVVDAAIGEVRLQLYPDERLRSPLGLVAGGIIATVLDTALAWACDTCAPPGKVCTTLELKTNFLGPLTVKNEPVVAVGKAVFTGNRVMVATGELISLTQPSKRYAIASATCLVL